MTEHLVTLRNLYVKYFMSDKEYQDFLKTIDKKDIIYEETY
jgi:hypothetical protein